MTGTIVGTSLVILAGMVPCWTCAGLVHYCDWFWYLEKLFLVWHVMVGEERGVSGRLSLIKIWFNLILSRSILLVINQFLLHPSFCTLFWLFCTGGVNYINRLILNYLSPRMFLCNFHKCFDVYCRSSLRFVFWLCNFHLYSCIWTW